LWPEFGYWNPDEQVEKNKDNQKKKQIQTKNYNPLPSNIRPFLYLVKNQSTVALVEKEAHVLKVIKGLSVQNALKVTAQMKIMLASLAKVTSFFSPPGDNHFPFFSSFLFFSFSIFLFFFFFFLC